ncbi:hypothetical protein ACLB2K_060193 [Fragaria x ananassa]
MASGNPSSQRLTHGFFTKLQALWNHPAAPKTIHFWAPTFKWGISVDNIADLKPCVSDDNAAIGREVRSVDKRRTELEDIDL